jgi:uracil-DNA glycosylase
MFNKELAEKHQSLMNPEWYALLQDILGSEDMANVYKHLAEERETGKELYPEQESIWKAFSYFKPSDLKVVILGQDPYPTPGVANGLAFAVGKPNYVPPSLQNINTVLAQEFGDDPKRSKAVAKKDYQDCWGEHHAKQGVLLLNRALTVERGKAGIHLKIWEPVISAILNKIVENYPSTIFLLWGSPAMKTFDELSESDPQYSVRTTHPSPFSWKTSSSKAVAFDGSNCFSQVNEKLTKLEKTPINW